MNQKWPGPGPADGWETRPPGSERSLRGRILASRSWALGALIVAVTILISCRTTAPKPQASDITLSLDAVPMLLKADSVSVSSIWATVLQSGHPVKDSTMVYFVASQGEVTPEATTKDGLARATFTPGKTPGVAAVIAQVKAVRDTVVITAY